MDMFAVPSHAANATLTVDLDAIATNWKSLQARAPEAICAAVVKADAYGLGLEQVATRLWRAGARWYFVAQIDEGLKLREVLPEANISVLSGVIQGAEVELVTARLMPVLNDPADIQRWASACRAAKKKLPAVVHVDTGMNRLGLSSDQLEHVLARPQMLQEMEIACVMSHLACGDTPGHELTAQQHSRFEEMRAKLPMAKRASLANSAGIFEGKSIHYDMVRPGCALYGLNPRPTLDNPMQPVVTVTARILQLRTAKSGETVGYGATWVAPKETRVATIGLGYADGIHRCLGNRFSFFLAGKRVPVIGRISMDLTAIDISALPTDAVRPGDEVQILGPDVTPDAMAAAAETIGYEILTSLGNRYRRIYRHAE